MNLLLTTKQKPVTHKKLRERNPSITIKKVIKPQAKKGTENHKTPKRKRKKKTNTIY